MVKLCRHVLLRERYNRWMTKEGGMGKVFIPLGIRVITRRRVQRRLGGGDGSKHVKGTITIRILSDRNAFCAPGEGEKRRGLMHLRLFCILFFFGCH